MIVVVVVIAVVLAAALFVLLTYNRLVAQRLTCENAWAQVEVALKQRHDLVPALVESVRGYATHERTTFERTAEARAEAIAVAEEGPRARIGPEGLLASGVSGLLGVAEAYPDLRASESFSRLQTDLGAVEERIAITRRVYNDTVERYNTAIAVFPPSVVARAFRFDARAFFSAEVEAHLAPSIAIGEGAR